jgi:glycosyltransferase involved in cell wall biosynthesis
MNDFGSGALAFSGMRRGWQFGAAQRHGKIETPILLVAGAAFGFPVRGRMKVVVFAHTPPPEHGQSRLVKLMLDGFVDLGLGIEVCHVNARFSNDLDDTGRFRLEKIFLLFRYLLQALKFRFLHGAKIFYYVPTPPLRTPLFRDWVILILLRPFFRGTIFHWHAAGLGEWLRTQPGWMRRISQWALGGAELSITMLRANEADALFFKPKRQVLTLDGIPDPCPEFGGLAVRRRERALQRKRLIQEKEVGAATKMSGTVYVLFMGLGIKEKGLFDAMEGTHLGNLRMEEKGIPLRFQLRVAGKFYNDENESLYRETLKKFGNPSTIEHVGFISGARKAELLAESDVFCFPTYYYAESFGLVLLEAMAYGVAIVTTRWRGNAELLPQGYPGLVDIKAPEQIASALAAAAERDDSELLRNWYLQNFTVERYARNLAREFHETFGD